jgi:hypothetical protein
MARSLNACGIVGVVLLLLLNGCPSTEKTASKELGRVAKDWSLMMRASQVIPIYPMSEDVQVGDMFVVQTPIGEEVALYESAKGFLPFDNLVKRLDPAKLNYTEFYPDGVYGVDGKVRPPAHWQFGPKPTTSPTSGPTSGSSSSSNSPGPLAGATTRPWVAAPQAAFPTFSFRVQRGGGATLALPVKSVPVGMGLLGSQDVEGQLTIADAYTYGIDRISLREQVKAWADDGDVKAFLKTFAPYEVTAQGKGSFGRSGTSQRKLVVNYLRVVSRVYAASSVTVSLTSVRQAGANVAVNNPLGANILGAATQPAAEYQTLLSAINDNLVRATTQPADQSTIGSVKVASISRRSVAMAETFPRPLVIGYIGFDFPIMPDGALGEGIPTRARLEQVLARSLDERIADWLYADRVKGIVNEKNRDAAREWIKQHPGAVDIPTLLYGVDNEDLRKQFVHDQSIP